MTCGIYMITNKKTGQKYIGRSVNIERRWNEHCHKGHIKNSYIDSSINKYGVSNFIIQVITELPKNQSLLNQHEKYWIKFYNTYEDDYHYNLTPGGEYSPMLVTCIKEQRSGVNHHMYGKRGKDTPMFGKHHSQEVRDKISKANIGKKRSKDVRKKLSIIHSGKKLSNDTRKKISQSLLGHNNHQAKYVLWNISACAYKKGLMFQDGRQPNPCKCFRLKYEGNEIKIGNFIDFLTCEIINNIIKMEDKE